MQSTLHLAPSHDCDVESKELIVNSSKSKRKMQLATAGMYHCDTCLLEKPWSCKICNAFFSTEQVRNKYFSCSFSSHEKSSPLFVCEQGVRTHAYQMHCCGKAMTEVQVEAGENDFCKHCNRSFPNSDAYFQHAKAKHGSFPTLKPEWSKEDETDTSLIQQRNHFDDEMHLSKEIECSVCGLVFATVEELETHGNNGFEPVVPIAIFECEVCSRTFSSSRAVLQHKNFCNT